MSKDRGEKESGEIIDFRRADSAADARRDARREAKAKDLKTRFAAARRAGESKSRAAARLKKLFSNPPGDHGNKPR